MTKYTVYFDQRNRTNYQVLAENVTEAEEKATKLYRKYLIIPCSDIEEGWLSEEDGEDK